MSGLAAFARLVHVLLLALWVGGGVFFAAVVAPEAFSVIQPRSEAGALVGALLARIDGFILIMGPALFLTLFAGWVPLGVRLRTRALAVLFMTGASLLSGYWLTPRMQSIQKAMGRAVEDLDRADPLRVEFERLHLASEGLMAVHLILALVLLFAALLHMKPKRSGLSSIEL